jgi:hypothetical protein
MNTHLKSAALLLSLPVLINGAVSYFLFTLDVESDFYGYAAGAFLHLIFVFLWLRNSGSYQGLHALSLTKKVYRDLVVKGVLFAVVCFGGYAALTFNLLYFTVAFSFGIIINIIVEIWYYGHNSIE